MSETPKTHRERAEEVVRNFVGKTDGELVDLIARETHPTELVDVATRALACDYTGRGLCPMCLDRLRAALALYEPEEAENG